MFTIILVGILIYILGTLFIIGGIVWLIMKYIEWVNT